MDELRTHQTVRLSAGSHAAPEEGVCVLELASMLNDEPFSDRPRSVCPALREFLQGYNDGLPDDLRQELYALASEIVDTHAPAPVTAWRARLCVGWARSVAAIEALPTRFPGPTLTDCGRAGRYTARVARGNRWSHSQTLAFFSWLARTRSARQAIAVPAPAIAPMQKFVSIRGTPGGPGLRRRSFA
jgi:hypothetical protein